MTTTLPRTSVALWVEPRSEKDPSALQLVLWKADDNDSLSYWAFHDHGPYFIHLDSLLQQLSPIHDIYFGLSTRKTSKALSRVKDQLVTHLSHRSDWMPLSGDESDERRAPSLETRLHQVEAEPLKKDADVSTLLQQLLQNPQEELLRLAGNLDFHENHVQKSLYFYLVSMGLPGSPAGNPPIASIQRQSLNSYMMLDRTAMEAIHLWPPINDSQAYVVGGKAHNNSIYGMLSHALCTKMGKSLLEHWLRQPLVDLAQLQERQDAVTCLVNQGVERDAIRDQGLQLLASLDLNKLALRLGNYASLDEENDGNMEGSTRSALHTLYEMYLVASQKVPSLCEQLEQLTTKSSLIEKISKELTDVNVELQRSTDLVEHVLDLEEAPREFRVLSTYKEELQDISEEIVQTENEIQDCFEQMNETWAQAARVANSSGTAVRLEQDNDNTYIFRLPNTNDSKILQNQLGSTVKVHKILKNGVHFTTKELRQLSTKKQDLAAEYDRHQRQVVSDVMKVASTYRPVLERASRTLSQLDVLVGLAHFAAYHPHGYCRPELTDSNEDGMGIILKEARHPCVELQESMEYIPNDVELEYGSSSFLFVTGPNMGGKSCYIRKIGAIVTLAQIGSYVPCKSAQINICHHILARVGAGDLQEKGISTFMAEMLESSAILRTATKRSLIIIDELGRGTSTFDGYGLARAISEYIIQKVGCFTVFATHFHELTALESHERVVKNRHVSAKSGTQGLQFLYELKPGPCLQSFGIQVAEMANMPPSVVLHAKAKAKELENFTQRNARASERGEGSNCTSTDETVAEAIDFVKRFRSLDGSVFEKGQNDSIATIRQAVTST